MTNILIRGGDVLTMEASAAPLLSTDVAVTDGLISGVGGGIPADFAPDEIVDATGHVLMPGLVNAHLHSGTVYSRGRSPYDSLDPWFDLRVTQDGQLQRELTSELTADDAYWSALLVAAELIRGGVTGFGDQYFFMDPVARATLECGLRANLSWCTFGSDEGEIGGDLGAIAAFAESWNGAGGGRIKTSLGPHSPYLCSPQFLARTAAVASRLGIGIQLHALESQEQVDFSALAYDMTPIEVLDNNGVLDVSVIVANAAYLRDVDVRILSSRGACVVACPTAQRAAGLGATPVRELQAAGITVGLGTDSAGLAGALDMFREVREAAASSGRNPVTVREALRLATWGGCQVLGFTNSGRVAPGYNADLILIDARKPHLWPLNRAVEAVGASARPGDVTDVMVGGRWLLRQGELTTIDEERVLAETASRAAKLFGSAEAQRGSPAPQVP